MNKAKAFSAAALLILIPVLISGVSNSITLKAVNKLPFSRINQTIELSSMELLPLGEKDLTKVHVWDATGNPLLCQAVDTDGDYTADQVIFQTDFAPAETKRFSISSGSKWAYTPDQFKAYGRFVHERLDDFAWENDRIAHRMYGKALETWAQEPLTSSAVDIWSKRVPRLVINNWYMSDNYHVDNGEGGSFYSAGASRGCGGNGLWAGNKIWTSRNFVNSRILANGPIRVLFELTYEPFSVNGMTISEVKRITLDAGQNLGHFKSTYKTIDASGLLISAIGLKKTAGEQKQFNAEHGWQIKWEKMDKNMGNQGLAIIVDPEKIYGKAEDSLNILVLSKVGDDATVSYWTGFMWDNNGADFNAWKGYVDHFAQGLTTPIELTVLPAASTAGQ
jgi:hypothetical protein